MITAVSAIANGGKLMQPYLVSKKLDQDGNTIAETVPTVKRQVVSESTA
jgi:stage V sporulation protein D (sporulation-specific penicillin-binding protein)